MQPITIPAEGLPPLPPGHYFYADFRNRSALNYLEIPALGIYRWRLARHWRFRIKGGPYFGYLLNARQKTRGQSQLYVDSNRTPLTIGGYELPPIPLDADLDILNDLHRWNVGITGGAGAAYLIQPRHEVYFDVRGEYGLRTLQRDSELNGSTHTGAVAFLFGYMYRLGR